MQAGKANMKVVVSAEAMGVGAPTSALFGRCPVYAFVDTDTMQVDSVPNPAHQAGGGAGIQAAQFIVAQGAKALLTGNVGPNACDVLGAARVDVYEVNGSTVEEAVALFKAGSLRLLEGPTVQSHAGTRKPVGRPGRPKAERLSALATKVAEIRRGLADVLTELDSIEREEQ